MPGCRRIVPMVLVTLAVAACEASDRPESPAPNLVFIIADDQSFRDFGFMGSSVVQTPNIDRLASQGTVFRSGYSTSSKCRPALRTLLTGLHPLQYFVREREIWAEMRETETEATPNRLIRRFDTLPRILTRHGWSSFQSGKHWEGSYRAAGFTHGMTVGSMDEGNRIVRETMQPVTDFIDRHVGSPFFLWFAPTLPHWPHDPPEEFRRLYADTSLSEPLRRYYGNASWLDWGVGQLLDHLDARGLRERTLVVFVVDNGWQALPHIGFRDGPKGKGSLHEVGWRTPIIFRWPGRIPSGVASDALVSIVDLFPTVLDYLGVPAPAELAGRNLRPLIEGRVETVRDAIFGHALVLRPREVDGQPLPPGQSPTSGAFVRTRRWYYIVYSDESHVLYELETDPEQERDVAAQHRDVVLRLHRRVHRWLAEMQGADGV